MALFLILIWLSSFIITESSIWTAWEWSCILSPTSVWVYECGCAAGPDHGPEPRTPFWSWQSCHESGKCHLVSEINSISNKKSNRRSQNNNKTDKS